VFASLWQQINNIAVKASGICTSTPPQPPPAQKKKKKENQKMNQRLLVGSWLVVY